MMKGIVGISLCLAMNAYGDPTAGAPLDLARIQAQDFAQSSAYTANVAALQQKSQTRAEAYTTLASFLQNKAVSGTASSSSSSIIVFVSLGMPALSLREIMTTAYALHIPVVATGVLNNSFKQSAKVLYGVLHPHGLPPLQGVLESDPVWFYGFDLAQVPAVVVVPPNVSCTDK